MIPKLILTEIEKSYQMNIFFIAFSFEHEPHIIVVILGKPFGATDIKIFCKRSGQSSPGNTPSAGRFINAKNEIQLNSNVNSNFGYRVDFIDMSVCDWLTFQIMFTIEHIQQLGMIVAQWNR